MPKLQEYIAAYVIITEISEGASSIVEALSQENPFTHPIFSRLFYPKSALLAWHQRLISTEQFTSIMLYWEAQHDYSDKLSNFKTYQINRADDECLGELRQFLGLFTVQEFLAPTIKAVVSDENFNAFLKKLLSDEVPASERCFSVFEINAEDIANILTIIPELGFKPFMPIVPKPRNGDNMLVIVPSFSMIQLFMQQIGSAGYELVPAMVAFTMLLMGKKREP